jgi:hypothetical protein
MDLNWTSKENIALNFIFEFIGESRENRTMAAYFEIETRLPKIEAAFNFVNSELRKIAAAGSAPYEICYFKKGDYGHYYEPYPAFLSRETVRKTIKKYREQVRVARQLVSH